MASISSGARTRRIERDNHGPEKVVSDWLMSPGLPGHKKVNWRFAALHARMCVPALEIPEFSFHAHKKKKKCTFITDNGGFS